MKTVKAYLVFLLAAAIFVSACEDPANPDENDNASLVVDALTIATDHLYAGTQVIVEASVTYTGEGGLSYQWEASGGSVESFSGDGRIVSWTLPDLGGEYEISTTVSDGEVSNTLAKSIDIVEVNPDLLPVAFIEGRITSAHSAEQPLNGTTACFIAGDGLTRGYFLTLVTASRETEGISVEWVYSSGQEEPNINDAFSSYWYPPSSPGPASITWTISDGSESFDYTWDVLVVPVDSFDTYARIAPGHYVQENRAIGTSGYSASISHGYPYFSLESIDPSGLVVWSSSIDAYEGVPYCKLTDISNSRFVLSHFFYAADNGRDLYDFLSLTPYEFEFDRLLIEGVTLSIKASDDEDDGLLIFGRRNPTWDPPPSNTFTEECFVSSITEQLETNWNVALPEFGHLSDLTHAIRLPNGNILLEGTEGDDLLWYGWLDRQGGFVDSTVVNGRSASSKLEMDSDGNLVALVDGTITGLNEQTLESEWSYGSGISDFAIDQNDRIVVCLPGNSTGVLWTLLNSTGSVVSSFEGLKVLGQLDAIRSIDLTETGGYLLAASGVEDDYEWQIRTDGEGQVAPDNIVYSISLGQ